ncbi:MAG: hypothetical protein WA172_00780 [Terriglobales bacterium]
MRVCRIVAMSLVVILTPAILNAGLLDLFKPHKKKQEDQTQAAQRAAARRRQMLRTESLPGILKTGGEPEHGPGAYEKEKYAHRAYPLKRIPVEFTHTAQRHFARVESETELGQRGEALNSGWVSLGPSVALFPSILGRTGASYVTSGRMSALAIENNCTQARCRLYVGAAGGGVWRTDHALSNAPDWTFISQSFGTNAIGSITVDPTDPSGDTIYVGTGEANASADSGAGEGIYKSTNGGDSWSLLPGSSFAVDNSVSAVVIDPTNSNTIYVATTYGIRGFTEVDDGSAIGTSYPVGLYKSTDGGNTFTLIFNPTPLTPGGFTWGVNRVALDPSDPTTVYAAAFALGIFRSSPTESGGAFLQVFVTSTFNPNPSLLDPFSRPEFALTTKSGHTRMYVGDGPGDLLGGEPAAAVWRNDNMNKPASVLFSGSANGPSWKMLSNSHVGSPGYATYNYCTSQCWYDNEIYTPPGQPDTVFVLGCFLYGEAGGLSNARGVLRSTTAGEPDPANHDRTFTDLTFDATSASTPNSLHPDQHTLVFMPGNPDRWWEGSDGGLMRSSGSYTDVSGQCVTRGLTATETTTCQRLLSSVPTTLTSLNRGLDTLQFQSLSINPKKPTGELLGGTQDNGTFRYDGSSVLWPETMGGDGGQSGFNAANPNISFHTYYLPQIDVNFQGAKILGWDWVSDRFFMPPAEGSEFYIPIIADPNPAKAGSMFAGLQGVWRTRDNGGPQAYLDQHCNEFFGDFTVTCGDWVELGSPTGFSDPHGDLTSSNWGSTLQGGVLGVVTRALSDTSTLWAATSTGRIFISKNADSVSNVSGADGSSVAYTRLDTLASSAPMRFPSAIYVDSSNPNHAWISYSGYSAATPATPGHVFDVSYNPSAGTATWTSLDGNLGDIPINSVVRDDSTGDLYAANDFGVLRLPNGSSQWQTAGSGLPLVEVPNLTISASARVLYAATHGRGAYVLSLP